MLKELKRLSYCDDIIAKTMNKNNLWLGLIGVLVLAGLFFLVKPKTPPSNSASQNTSQDKIFNLVIQNKKIVSGDETLQVKEGDQITINVLSDEADELHVHGYDKSVDLEASKSAQLMFSANLTGRFPYELEKSKTEIGALEVQPK